MPRKPTVLLGVVERLYNPSTEEAEAEAEAGGNDEHKVTLYYMASLRLAQAI